MRGRVVLSLAVLLAVGACSQDTGFRGELGHLSFDSNLVVSPMAWTPSAPVAAGTHFCIQARRPPTPVCVLDCPEQPPALQVRGALSRNDVVRAETATGANVFCGAAVAPGSAVVDFTGNETDRITIQVAAPAGAYVDDPVRSIIQRYAAELQDGGVEFSGDVWPALGDHLRVMAPEPLDLACLARDDAGAALGTARGEVGLSSSTAGSGPCTVRAPRDGGVQMLDLMLRGERRGSLVVHGDALPRDVASLASGWARTRDMHAIKVTAYDGDGGILWQPELTWEHENLEDIRGELAAWAPELELLTRRTDIRVLRVGSTPCVFDHDAGQYVADDAGCQPVANHAVEKDLPVTATVGDRTLVTSIKAQWGPPRSWLSGTPQSGGSSPTPPAPFMCACATTGRAHQGGAGLGLALVAAGLISRGRRRSLLAQRTRRREPREP